MSDVHLNIPILVSKLHVQLLIGAHALLLILMLAAPLSMLSRGLLITALMGNGFWLARGMRAQKKLSRLLVDDNQFAIVFNEKRIEAERLTPVFISDWLVILKIKAGDQWFWPSLWSDSSDAESLRQLRVWLLCGKWRK